MTDSTPLPQVLNNRDLDRLRRYRENLAFYQGDQWDQRTVRARQAGRGGRLLTLNYARVIVDKVASYLASELNFAVEPVGADRAADARRRAAAAEAALYQAADANQLALLDFETEIDTAILGDGAFKVTWDAAARRVRITAPDVQGLYVWTAGDDLTRLRRLAHRYRLPAATIREQFGYSIGETTAPVIEDWTADRLTIWIGDQVAESGPNPYGWIPYVVFPNLRTPKEFWGTSDLEPLREPIRELNRAYSQLSQILELSGNPIAVLENLEAAEDIAVAPGAVWEIPERAKAYLLDLLQGGGVRLHADYINLVYRTIHDLGEAPRTVFGENRQALSGVALEVELQPLIQKVKRKRLIRTAAYQQRAAMILKLRELFTEERYGLDDLQIRVIWAPITPRDLDREVARAQTLITTGIHSRRRLADDLGITDSDAEFARWLEEQRQIAMVTRERGSGIGDQRAGGIGN